MDMTRRFFAKLTFGTAAGIVAGKEIAREELPEEKTLDWLQENAATIVARNKTGKTIAEAPCTFKRTGKVLRISGVEFNTWGGVIADFAVLDTTGKVLISEVVELREMLPEEIPKELGYPGRWCPSKYSGIGDVVFMTMIVTV